MGLLLFSSNCFQGGIGLPLFGSACLLEGEELLLYAVKVFLANKMLQLPTSSLYIFSIFFYFIHQSTDRNNCLPLKGNGGVWIVLFKACPTPWRSGILFMGVR